MEKPIVVGQIESVPILYESLIRDAIDQSFMLASRIDKLRNRDKALMTGELKILKDERLNDPDQLTRWNDRLKASSDMVNRLLIPVEGKKENVIGEREKYVADAAVQLKEIINIIRDAFGNQVKTGSVLKFPDVQA